MEFQSGQLNIESLRLSDDENVKESLVKNQLRNCS